MPTGQIAQDINIGLDAICFVDDQPFEREEVAFTHDKVLCVDSALLDDFLDSPALKRTRASAAACTWRTSSATGWRRSTRAPRRSSSPPSA
jgi:hypothetical protein